VSDAAEAAGATAARDTVLWRDTVPYAIPHLRSAPDDDDAADADSDAFGAAARESTWRRAVEVLSLPVGFCPCLRA
jgi:hypothetical protein